MPALPIPALNDTKYKLLKWIEPLVNKEQFRQTIEVVEHFFDSDGEGQKLQEKLYEWDKSVEGSWLKPFWDDSYLKYRGSLPTGMHFNILLDNKNYSKQYSMPELAGKVSHFITEFYHSIIDEKVEPQILNGVPLDMDQYKSFFRSVRIPKIETDEFRVANFDKKNNHVVILYRNNVYKVDVTNNEGAIYQSKEIAAAIEKTLLAEGCEGIGIGLFTTAAREEAAKVYGQFIESEVNAKSLQTIADSLVVISVDEESENAEEAIKNLMLNGANKYYDKTIQVVITKSGELGYSIEHSAVDGTTIFAVISYVNEGLCNVDTETIYTTDKTEVEKMEWEISKEIEQSLIDFQSENRRTQNNFHVKSRTFKDFGSDAIKQMNISPDAFFHMALQIAQYRTFGQIKSVYEPVSVRQFYGGRTECARASSMEKSTLVRALEDGEKNNEVLYDLMQVASAAHSNRIADCRKGLGVERHMFGLEQIYHLHKDSLSMNELPAIFNDEGYLAMRHDFISTSGMAYDGVKYRIFGPAIKDGYGLAYILFGDSISINTSCKTLNKESAKDLTKNLVEALKELKRIAESCI